MVSLWNKLSQSLSGIYVLVSRGQTLPGKSVPTRLYPTWLANNDTHTAQLSSPLFSSHSNNLSTSLSNTCCLYFRRQRACSFYIYAYHVVPGGKASMVHIVLKEAFHSVTISPPCTLMMWQRPYTLFLKNFFYMTYTCICLLTTTQWLDHTRAKHLVLKLYSHHFKLIHTNCERV